MKWVVLLALITPEGTTVTTKDNLSYPSQYACEQMKPIRLMHVMDVLTKYHMRLDGVTCVPDE